MSDRLFSEIRIGHLVLRNRLVRSATYEGAADRNGIPGDGYLRLYEELARNSIGLIVTGFTHTSKRGRAMQPFQAGIDGREKVQRLRVITDAVHAHNTPIVMQIAHTGRQSRTTDTGGRLLSTTTTGSVYFRGKPKKVTAKEIQDLVAEFVNAAVNAKEAGFDGIQLHAAHGYLIHQFLHPYINKLRNGYGINPETGIGAAFLGQIITGIRETCGPDYPILVKISGDTDLGNGFYPERFDNLVRFLNDAGVAAIEISYGTMDYPMNIFRGDLNLKLAARQNPFLQSRFQLVRSIKKFYFGRKLLPKFLPFTSRYNLTFAARAKTLTRIPVISVGGFRKKSEMEAAIREGSADLVSMSRPFLCEPDLAVTMMNTHGEYVSKCNNCNHCVLFCDSHRATQCYLGLTK